MANPIDLHVGRRVRQRRWVLGLTQQQLAQALGIRFQQVQKYESGANRISASRLFDLSRALQVSVGFFYDGLGETDAQLPVESPEPLKQRYQGKETHELLRAYYGLSEGPRRRFLELAKAIAVMPAQGAAAELL